MGEPSTHDAREFIGQALDEHGPLLLASARALMGNEAEAQDLVQTTLEIALRKVHQLRDPASIRAWLMTIETREAFRLRRHLRGMTAVGGQPQMAVHQMSVPAASAEDLAIREVLAELPSRTRAAVVLHYMVGLSVDETAHAMGVSSNTVKSQLKSGIARVRELWWRNG